MIHLKITEEPWFRREIIKIKRDGLVILMKKKMQIENRKKKRNKTVIKNSINVGKLMRRYAPGMNISSSAIDAMIDRIEMFIETAMPEISKIAKANGCKKTIKESENLDHPEKSQAHITLYFGIVDNNIKEKIGGE